MPEPRHSSGLAILCRAGARICGIPVEYVAETMRPLPIEPVAHTPDFVLGLAVVRGSPTPVIDLGRILGATAPGVPTRFVAVRCGERAAVLAVDAILGVAPLPERALDDLPPIVRDASRGAIDAVAALDTELLFVLTSARLLPEPIWSVLDAHRTGGTSS